LLLTSENDIDRQLQKERFESNNATALQGLSHGQDLHRRELQDSAAASTVTTPAVAKAAAATAATVTSAATLPARGGIFAQCLMPQ
jgi:hypothetical protein